MLYRLLSHCGYFLNAEQIAQREWRLMDAESKAEIVAVPQAATMIRYHITYGRDIRNEYGLWNPACPLTKPWHDRKRNAPMLSSTITDHDPTHPDAVSMDILYRIWEIAHPR